MIAAGWRCGFLYDQAPPSEASTTGSKRRSGAGVSTFGSGFNVDLTSLHHDLRGYASSTERSREKHRMDGPSTPGRDAGYRMQKELVMPETEPEH